MPSILEYPPFHEVIRWDGTNRVLLEQPQVLESYILKPVFGLPTLDIFKGKLLVCTPAANRITADALPLPYHRYSVLASCLINPWTKTPTQKCPYGVPCSVRFKIVV